VSSYNLPNYNPPVFMPPDSVREGIMFLDWTVRPPRSFVRPFIHTDLATMMSHERLEQSRWNLQGISTSS